MTRLKTNPGRQIELLSQEEEEGWNQVGAKALDWRTSQIYQIPGHFKFLCVPARFVITRLDYYLMVIRLQTIQV